MDFLWEFPLEFTRFPMDFLGNLMDFLGCSISPSSLWRFNCAFHDRMPQVKVPSKLAKKPKTLQNPAKSVQVKSEIKAETREITREFQPKTLRETKEGNAEFQQTICKQEAIDQKATNSSDSQDSVHPQTLQCPICAVNLDPSTAEHHVNTCLDQSTGNDPANGTGNDPRTALVSFTSAPFMSASASTPPLPSIVQHLEPTVHSDMIGLGNLFFCMFCGKDLTLSCLEDRQIHTNACLEASISPSKPKNAIGGSIKHAGTRQTVLSFIKQGNHPALKYKCSKA